MNKFESGHRPDNQPLVTSTAEAVRLLLNEESRLVDIASLSRHSMERADNDEKVVGKILYETLSRLPEDGQQWEALGAFRTTYSGREQMEIASYCIFNLAATNPDIAEGFCKHLNADPELLSTIPEDLAYYGLLQPWHAVKVDARAEAQLAATLCKRLSVDRFEKLLHSQAQVALPDQKKLETFDAYLGSLAGQEELDEAYHSEVTTKQAQLESAFNEVRARQLSAQLQAQLAAVSKNHLDEAAFQALQDNQILARLYEVDPTTAVTEELTLNCWLITNNPESPLAAGAISRQQEIIQALITDIQTQESLQLPYKMKGAIGQELVRQANALDANTPEAYQELIAVARHFDIAGLETRINKIQERKVFLWDTQKLIEEWRLESAELPPYIEYLSPTMLNSGSALFACGIRPNDIELQDLAELPATAFPGPEEKPVYRAATHFNPKALLERCQTTVGISSDMDSVMNLLVTHARQLNKGLEEKGTYQLYIDLPEAKITIHLPPNVRIDRKGNLILPIELFKQDDKKILFPNDLLLEFMPKDPTVLQDMTERVALDKEYLPHTSTAELKGWKHNSSGIYTTFPGPQ